MKIVLTNMNNKLKIRCIELSLCQFLSLPIRKYENSPTETTNKQTNEPTESTKQTNKETTNEKQQESAAHNNKQQLKWLLIILLGLSNGTANRHCVFQVIRIFIVAKWMHKQAYCCFCCWTCRAITALMIRAILWFSRENIFCNSAHCLCWAPISISMQINLDGRSGSSLRHNSNRNSDSNWKMDKKQFDIFWLSSKKRPLPFAFCPSYRTRSFRCFATTRGQLSRLPMTARTFEWCISLIKPILENFIEKSMCFSASCRAITQRQPTNGTHMHPVVIPFRPSKQPDCPYFHHSPCFSGFPFISIIFCFIFQCFLKTPRRDAMPWVGVKVR